MLKPICILRKFENFHDFLDSLFAYITPLLSPTICIPLPLVTQELRKFSL